MGRPRKFDTDELLEQVSLIFLEHGLQNTSCRQLESLTGVKQVSLFNAFGSKDKLFVAAFDHWANKAAQIQSNFMKEKGVEGIINFIDAIVSNNSPFPLPGCGCLAVNTAMLSHEVGPQVTASVAKYREEFITRIHNALLRAETNNEIKPEQNLANLAEMILSSIWGIFVFIRLSQNHNSSAKPAAQSLIQVIHSL